jgi:hypothetical protein
MKKLHNIVAGALSFTMRGARYQSPPATPARVRFENMLESPAVGGHISMVFGLITRKIKREPERSISSAPGIV